MSSKLNWASAYDTPSKRAAAIRNRRRASIDASADWEAIALRRRFRAGVWGARIAFVLSVPFAIAAWAAGAEAVWLFYMLLPVLAAFFSTALVGAAILDPCATTDAALAGRRGALAALIAYAIYAAEAGAMSTLWLHTTLDYFMGSLLMTGWLVMPVAFLSGVMAYRTREGATKYVSARHGQGAGPAPTEIIHAVHR